ncbi:MAG: hypothetical protein JW955_09215 [Sedimentisphaerales bacterium]|nr:hypothetical protein [Sedimentisphaerales bacterium]
MILRGHDAKPSRYVLVKANGGMGNRMLCAVTGILYGQLTGRTTVVDWRDPAYSVDGTNTFSTFFTCPDVHPETVLPAEGTIRPALWAKERDASISDMLHKYDPTKHSSIFIHRKYSVDVRKLDYDEDIIVFWYYTQRIRALCRHFNRAQSDLAGLSIEGVIREVLTKRMMLQEGIRRQMDEFKAKHWADQVIGLHVRHSDKQTNLAAYKRALVRILRRAPKAHIFLATDNRAISDEYHREFRNVFSTPKWFPDDRSSMHQNDGCPDRVANAIEALVDMYLLSCCDYLIYPSASTFSWISHILSGLSWDRVVDIHRFNAKVRIKRLIRELVV